eukprot:3231348-Amphidinium_carterae.1
MGPYVEAYELDTDVSGNPVFLEVDGLPQETQAGTFAGGRSCGVSGRCWAKEWLTLRDTLAGLPALCPGWEPILGGTGSGWSRTPAPLHHFT